MFIAALRKQREMTQKELADVIGITDKAVSRWETGKGFPDVSLLIPISEELGVSIAEIIMGEKIEERTVEIMDKALIGTLEYSQRKIKTLRKLIYWGGNSLPILICGFMYAVSPQSNWWPAMMAIIPIYCIIFNFAFEFKAAFVLKLIVIGSVEAVCAFMYLAGIANENYPVVWFIFGTANITAAAGVLTIFLVSKMRRKTMAETDIVHVEIKGTSLFIYGVISLAAPVIFVYLGYLLAELFGKIYWELAGSSAERLMVHFMVYMVLLAAAAGFLLIYEIKAAIQIYTKGESKIPLIGKLAERILRR
jgi:transcriptional regulator with XRE-family HTH domain